jgi:hypothetical protein
MYKKINQNRFFLKNISLFLFIQILLTSCSNLGNRPTPILLFEQQTKQTRQIYRVNPDGSQLELIMEFPLDALYWLSPPGNSLAVLTPQATGLPGPRSGTLTLYDTATGEAFQTLEEVGQQASEIFPLHENVVWSPDGDKLLFLRSSPNAESVNLFLYDLSTEEVKPLTNDDGLNLAAAWSPSGDKVAFAKLEACGLSAWDCLPEEQFWEIVITELDGSSAHPITNFRSNKLLSPGNLWFTSLCNLAWSPDATYLAFENECGGELLGTKYWKEVFLTSADGRELRRLTTFTDAHDSSSNTLPETAFTYSLQWSSDSNTLFIGYTNVAATPDNQPRGGILATTNNADLSTYLPATKSVIGSSARWSLDTEYVAWHTQHVNLERYNVPGPTVFGKLENAQIAILNEQEELPIGPCTSQGIYWSLDSKFAAYIANKPGASCGDADVDQSIAIVSLPDLTFTQIAELLEGDIQLIGWTYEFGK